MTETRKIRLFVEKGLAPKASIDLSEKQSHYLTNVMRCVSGEGIRCFNAKEGEYFAKIIQADKKNTRLLVGDQVRPASTEEKDVWLVFAPLKKDRTDFVIEKAVELGASTLLPVITKRTNTDRIKLERYLAQAAEAAEQSERLSVPVVEEPKTLKKMLEEWDKTRILFFMDERRSGQSALKVFSGYRNQKSALLIGPEGGFEDEEADLLNKCPFVRNISLGPRVLRAETAAVAALAVWQAAAGDWEKENK